MSGCCRFKFWEMFDFLILTGIISACTEFWDSVDELLISSDLPSNGVDVKAESFIPNPLSLSFGLVGSWRLCSSFQMWFSSLRDFFLQRNRIKRRATHWVRRGDIPGQIWSVLVLSCINPLHALTSAVVPQQMFVRDLSCLFGFLNRQIGISLSISSTA